MNPTIPDLFSKVREKQIYNTFIVPFSLYAGGIKIITDAAIRDDDVLFLDGEGHVHYLKNHGRIIDQEPTDND